MDMKFLYIYLLVLLLVCVEGKIVWIYYEFKITSICSKINQGKKDKEKPTKNDNDGKDRDKDHSTLQHNPSPARPQYINQFSQSLRFLSSFFQVIQRQLNTTLETFDPDKPNPSKL